jgi:hypothetical protein
VAGLVVSALSILAACVLAWRTSPPRGAAPVGLPPSSVGVS